MDILKNRARLLLLPLLLMSLIQPSIATNSTQKQKVVAAAIFKFIKFIDWETPNTAQASHFNMCLQQEDSAFQPFESRTIGGKNIKVLLINKTTQLLSCHAVYLNNTTEDASKSLADFKNTLTISGQTGFIEQGGIIELNDYNNRLAFSINVPASKQQSLNIGFQLLSLARHVIES